MHEALYRLIQAHYIEILAILPAVFMMAGLAGTVRIDQYIQKRHRQIMLVICVLVFSLILQNELDYLLTVGQPMIRLRILADIYGYCVRPVILLLFLYIVSPRKIPGLCWVLVGINAGIYLTALFTDVCFTINSENRFQGGWPLLRYSCMITSLVFLALLLFTTFRNYGSSKNGETWIPVFSVFLIVFALLLDGSVHDTPQPVTFLTVSIVISSVFYYTWLHFQFVRVHESALEAEQRIQIMMTQIQPHFLYNTLATIRGLCLRSPETAAQTIDKFSRYLRQNLDTLDQTGLVPFRQELEHVRIYTEIEMLMFPYIHIRYDVEDEDFLLPVLSVQPLVENAVRHGVRARDTGEIDIVVRKNEEGHTITISDNGLGFDPAAIDPAGGKHVGIRNVRERLEQQCGGSLSVDSRIGEGTTITLFVPRIPENRQAQKKLGD